MKISLNANFSQEFNDLDEDDTTCKLKNDEPQIGKWKSAKQQEYVENIDLSLVEELIRKIYKFGDLPVNDVNMTIQRILLSSAKLTFPVKAGNQSSGARLTKTLPGYNLDSRMLKQNYYRAQNKYKQNENKNNLDDLRDKSKA